MLDFAVAVHSDEEGQAGHEARGLDIRTLHRLLFPACTDGCLLCKGFRTLSLQAALVDALCRMAGRELLVLTSNMVEAFRTAGASLLLERWFLHDSREKGLPLPLVSLVRPLLKARATVPSVARTQAVDQENRTLLIEVFGLDEEILPRSKGCLVSLREVEPLEAAPDAWRQRLSPRQFEIASLILQGASNEIIASHFRTATGTVKKQVSSIFDRLGVNTRAQLCSLAARHRG